MTTVSPIEEKRSEQARKGGTDDKEIILLCNPQAGGRWKELADILDSEEARRVRRIVTDSIDDIGPALSQLGHATQLVCIYGGDGTIQQIVDRMHRRQRDENVQLAFIGGGTMNVTGRWCGLSRSPGKNFRYVVRAFESGELMFREVPLLEIRQGSRVFFGFTFGLGPLIRILNEYEKGSKGKAAALAIVAKSVAAVWSKVPAEFQPVLEEMNGEVLIDGEPLPFDKYTAVFANITGRINLLVEPFTKQRTRETFYCAAFAVNKRELAAFLPFLARGRMPIDPMSLLKPVSTWKQIALSYLGKGSFPTDPRYINDTASAFEVNTDEKLFTVDGEIFPSTGEPFSVRLGPRIKLAVGPTAGLSPTMRLAADVQDQLIGQ